MLGNFDLCCDFVIVSGLALRDIITRSARYCRAPRYIIARGAVAGINVCLSVYFLYLGDTSGFQG